MNNVPEAVLHECLSFMEQGESTEQILARYPDMAASLRPFLETAAQLATLAPQPSLAAKQKSQKAFLTHAASLKVTPVRPSLWYRLRQALLPFVSLAIVLILFAITAVSVSSSAIPGDALYSVKRLVETVRLNQTNEPTAVAALMEQYRQERIREVQTLLRTRRSAEVAFVGEVQAIQTEAWTVAAIKVTVNDETNLIGQPQVGEMALVNGRTAEGTLIAASIEMLTGSPTSPEPTATPEPTLLPTITATTTLTGTPTATTTEDPTATATATPTVRATITSSSTPAPTATATPSATTPPANDNDDDGNNDNGGNDNDDNDNDDNGNDDNDNDDNSNDDNDNDDNGNDGNDNDDNDNDDNDNDDNDNDDNDNDDDDNDNDDNSGKGNNNNDNGAP